jgi:hypothetical protein
MTTTNRQEARGDTVSERQPGPGLTIAGVPQRGAIHWNLSRARLVEEALRRDEGALAANGALTALTGKYTGRSPGDKFVVDRASYHQRIWWGAVNQPLAPEVFERLHGRIAEYFQDRELFVLDATVGADAEYGITVRVIGEYAWHCHFAQLLFRDCQLGPQPERVPDFTVLAAPGFQTDPQRDGTNSETVVALDLEQNSLPDRGDRVCGRDQEVALHGDELSAAVARRPADALLGEHGRGGGCSPLLRPLRHRQNDPLHRPDAPVDRRRRARLERSGHF